jgi:DNA-binding NtrC family response regulator
VRAHFSTTIVVVEKEPMARLLLVEDDPTVLMLLEHVLRGEGYGVDCADTVGNARRYLARRQYDLVVTDGRLPDGTGMMVGDEAGEKGTKTLIITGYAFQLPREDLIRYEYLLKPVRPAELLRAIERALDVSNASTGDEAG